MNNSTAVSATRDVGQSFDSGAMYFTNSNLTGFQNTLASFGGTTTDPNIIQVNGGVLIAQNGDIFHGEGTIAQLRLENVESSNIRSGSGNLLNVPVSTLEDYPDPSDVTFTVENSKVKGNIISAAVNHTVVNLNAQSTVIGMEQDFTKKPYRAGPKKFYL